MKIINTETGFFKVYWDLFNNEYLDSSSIFLFSYILDVYDLLKETHTDPETNEVYKRLSNSFIQERLFDYTDYIIREALAKLEKAGLIKVKTLRKANDKPNRNTNGKNERWIKLNLEGNLKNFKVNNITIIQEDENTKRREEEDKSLPSQPISVYQPLYNKFREILQGGFIDIKTIMEWAEPLLKRDYSIQDMLDVIECKGKEWAGEEKMRQWIRPQTLFKPEKFSEYLQQSKVVLYNPARLAEQELQKKKQQEYEEYLKRVNSPEFKAEKEAYDNTQRLLSELLEKKGWNISESSRKSLVDKLRGYSEAEILDMFNNSDTLIEIYNKTNKGEKK